MKQSQILELPHLLPSSYENIFNVYRDSNNMYYYNLLETVLVPELPPGYFNTYTIQPKDTWANISYYVYKTTVLWWLILHVNKITNPLSPLNVGQSINILKPEYIPNIISAMK